MGWAGVHSITLNCLQQLQDQCLLGVDMYSSTWSIFIFQQAQDRCLFEGRYLFRSPSIHNLIYLCKMLNRFTGRSLNVVTHSTGYLWCLQGIFTIPIHNLFNKKYLESKRVKKAAEYASNKLDGSMQFCREKCVSILSTMHWGKYSCRWAIQM